jgi:hypothetical protein
VSRPSQPKRESVDGSPSERVIFRRSDGTLRERDGQRLGIARLRDEVRAGNRFRAYQQETGVECTYQLLVELLGSALPSLIGLHSQPDERDTLLHALRGDAHAIRSGNGDPPRWRSSPGRR